MNQAALQTKFNDLKAMIPQTTEDVDVKINRYFFYAGDEPGRKAPGGLSVQSLSVPERVILRCAVTPCLTTYRFGKYNPSPDGIYTDIKNLIPGSETEGLVDNWGKTRPGYAKEWVYAGHEAKGLMDTYGNVGDPSRNWGLIELKALRGMTIEEVYGTLNIDGVFFPEWPKIPETNGEVRLQIEAVKDALSKDKLPGIKPENKAIYLECADEMLSAVEAADYYQTNVMRRTNVSITVPSGDPEFKKEADARDHVFSKRTGIPILMNASRTGGTPVDDMVNKLAEALKANGAPAAIDPTMIASIVSATVAALKEQGGSGTTGAKKN